MTLRVGQTVRYERNATQRSGTIVKIERCARRGDKLGQRVEELAWAERELAFLTLDTGHCYGTELVPEADEMRPEYDFSGGVRGKHR